MTNSDKDVLTSLGVFIFFAGFWIWWAVFMFGVNTVKMCKSQYEDHIRGWTEQQKTEADNFCKCVVNHPVSEISDEDLSRRESRILRQTAYDTCFGKVMVF